MKKLKVLCVLFIIFIIGKVSINYLLRTKEISYNLDGVYKEYDSIEKIYYGRSLVIEHNKIILKFKTEVEEEGTINKKEKLIENYLGKTPFIYDPNGILRFGKKEYVKEGSYAFETAKPWITSR